LAHNTENYRRAPSFLCGISLPPPGQFTSAARWREGLRKCLLKNTHSTLKFFYKEESRVPAEQATTWSTRLERITKRFIFLVTARGVVNVMKAGLDQCLESNQQKILSIVSLELYASNPKNNRLILKSIIILDST